MSERKKRARTPDEEKGGTEIVYELYGLTDEEIEIVEDAATEAKRDGAVAGQWRLRDPSTLTASERSE